MRQEQGIGCCAGHIGIANDAPAWSARACLRRSVTSRLVAQVDTGQRLRHVVSWFDETTLTSRAKPALAAGCQIWVKAGGDPPTDPETECVFKAMDTATPHMLQFESAQGGQLVHYCLRWQSKNGSTGPWSETVTATIGA